MTFDYDLFIEMKNNGGLKVISYKFFQFMITVEAYLTSRINVSTNPDEILKLLEKVREEEKLVVPGASCCDLIFMKTYGNLTKKF